VTSCKKPKDKKKNEEKCPMYCVWLTFGSIIIFNTKKSFYIEIYCIDVPWEGTSVVLLRYPFVPEIMHGRAPEVFLHQ
jgi:hypothetical protein